ncbi:MAG: cation:proton antiporter [Pseudomonadota bacterium]
MDHDFISIGIVFVVFLGVVSQWIAWKLRLPAIVLLSIAGLIAGPGLGLVDPSAQLGELLRPLIGLCVAVILFEGGLSLNLAELKHARSGVRRLVYLGAPLAWVFSGACAYFIGGFDAATSLVFGAIMVVTGPTVIMPLLRQAALNRRTASYLKWEGIVNDPIGALLAVLVFQFFVFSGQGSGLAEVFESLGLAMLSGLLFGGIGGWLTGLAFRAGMVPEYLKSPVMLGMVLMMYVAANYVQHEAGLLAVTIMGIVIANMNLPGFGDMRRFKEYITIMLVSLVFILLTADLDIASLASIGWRGGALVAALLLLARPAAIMLATINADMEFRERVLLAWIAPRGIVAAATAGIMGPGLIDEGYQAEVLLPMVFAVIFATVLLHGFSLNWLAARLGLASRHRDSVVIVGASPWSTELARTLNNIGVNVLISDSSWHALREARLAGLQVFYGEILSEFAEESVELAHVRTVLAATSNDAYNALVCSSIAPEVGQDRVFQLPMGRKDDDDPKAVARGVRGRIAFDKDAVYEKLWRNYVRGWTFARTRLSDTYSYSDFLGDQPADALTILVVSANDNVQFVASQTEIEPKSGDTIVYFAPPKPKKSPEAAGDAEASPA